MLQNKFAGFEICIIFLIGGHKENNTNFENIFLFGGLKGNKANFENLSFLFDRNSKIKGVDNKIFELQSNFVINSLCFLVAIEKKLTILATYASNRI